MRNSILTAILVFLTLCSWAQSHTIHHYGLTEGLPSSEVYDVFQDQEGFLWFGTDNGVVKYDGYTFTTYQVKDGLSDQVVFGFHQDKQGRIWFRTYSGQLSYYQDGKIHAYEFNGVLKEKIKKGILLQINYDDDRGLIFTTYGLIAGQIDTTGKFSQFEMKLNSLNFKRMGGDYLLGSSGLHDQLRSIIIDDKEFPIQLSNNFYNFNICTVTWQGLQLFSIGKDIFLYDGKEVKRAYTGKHKIISLSVDRNNRLWIGYSEVGAECFENQKFENPQHYDFTQNKSVTKVFQDTEEGLWFSTLEKGILYVPNIAFQINSNLSDSRICAVLSTRKFTLAGDYKGNLYIIDHASEEITTRKYPTIVLSMLETSAGEIWICTVDKVYILDRKLKPIRELKSRTLFDIAEARDGSIWGLSYNLHHYDVEGNLIGLSKKIDGNSKAFLVDGDKIILNNKTGGLYSFDVVLSDTIEIKEFADVKVSKIQKPTDSTYLISTIGNGIYLTDTNFKRIRKFNSTNNFIADNIYTTMIVDSCVWLGTEKGIAKTSLKSLHSVQPFFNLISKQSGLLDNQVTYLSNAGDNILAFGNNGFSIIPHATKAYANQAPTFYIKKLTVNNLNQSYEEQLELPFDLNNIQLDFGFIAFNHQDISVRYRLNPESQWNYPTERTINLFSLSPGKYSFELQYSADRIHWVKATPIPFILITPPWWGRIEFQIAIILVCVSIIYFFFHARLVIYRQRMEKMELLSRQQQQLIKTEIDTLERERSRIAKDIHDGVGTNILATKLGVSRILKKHQDPESEAIENQFQDTMVEIKEIIYNLSPPGLERYGLATAVKNYTERLATSTVIQFEVNIFGDELVDRGLSVPLFRVLQELITNSLKHSNTKTISIHLNSFEDLYNIVYEDNGIGFSMTEKPKGLGLHSIESRIQAIHGKLTCESGSFGVSYTIDVPLKKK